MKQNLLDRVRATCLAWPDTEESSRLGGSPHFYVNGKIFAGCGDDGGVWSFGVKVGLPLQALLITRPGITVAKYVGRYGWISVEERALQDAAELQRLLRLSYDLICGKDGSVCATGPAPKRAQQKKAKPAVKRAKKQATPAHAATSRGTRSRARRPSARTR